MLMLMLMLMLIRWRISIQKLNEILRINFDKAIHTILITIYRMDSERLRFGLIGNYYETFPLAIRVKNFRICNPSRSSCSISDTKPIDHVLLVIFFVYRQVGA
jgi:hypothetical protein